MTQPRKPKGAPNSAGGQYDTYAHTTPSGLPALTVSSRGNGNAGRAAVSNNRNNQPRPLVWPMGGMGRGEF